MRKHLRNLVSPASIATLVLPVLTLAQGIPGQSGGVQQFGTNVTTVQAFLDRICAIVNLLFTVLIIAAIIFIIIAAFNYLTAGGDPEKIKKASNQLLYAAIAVAVALFSKAIPLVVANLFGGQGVTGCT